MKRLHSRRPTASRGSRGFALIEALVAILILSFGVMGLVGLQVAMTKAQTTSKFRADAAFLASDLVGAMWADVPHIASYATASCSAYARCNAWSTKLAAALPNGASTVTVAANVVTITITWTAPGESASTYTTTLAIQV